MINRRLCLLACAAAALSGCTGVFFQPTRALYRKPEDLGLKYEAVRFSSSDGVGLTGLFLFASTGPVRGTVVQFHGNGENMTSHFGFSYWLTAYGYNVFIFDYRGYGASDGSASESGAVADGTAALDYVRRRKDVDPERLAVWGQSLGGAIAVASVSKAKNLRLRALILESAFNSYQDMAEDVLSRSVLTWALRWPLSRLLISDRESPERFSRGLPACPTLVIAGDKDRVVPKRLSERLYAKLKSPKEFWEVPDGGHLEAFNRLGAIYRPRLAAFLDGAFPGQ